MTAPAVRVYRPAPTEGYEWALPVEDVDFERISMLGADPAGGSWQPIPFEIQRVDDRGNPLKRADMPWYGSDVLILRDAAIDVVGPLLSGSGELHSLAVADGRLCLFAARLLAGSLDEGRSEIVRFDSGRIMDLRRPVLREDVVAGVPAFRLAEMPRGDAFLSEELVEAITATGRSSGTDFELVYDSSERR